jgi:hypothetical protein
MLVPQDDAGQRLAFHWLHGFELKLGEMPNLLLGEPDICKCILVKGCYASVYLRLRKTEIFAVPPVKADGHFANSIVAAVCDVGERAIRISAWTVAAAAASRPAFR